MIQYKTIAGIIRSRGIKGEIEIYDIDGLFHSLRPGAKLWVVPPTLEGVRQTAIVSQRGSYEAPWLMLEGVNDRAAATSLIGRFLLADEEDCLIDQESSDRSLLYRSSQQALSAEDQPIPPNAVGLKVYDQEHGYIGSIIEESRATPQVLWTLDGPYGQVLVPAVEAFVESWDDSIVNVDLPAGLLELNK
ncbi:MAG: hypothetical protein FWD45_04810 [Coriobacteriia bacterium]|nr:hypothetical protein [Coriobacteriia bacterium]